MAIEAASAPPQWRPEDDPDYGRRMLGHVLARYLWLIGLGGLLGGIIFLIVSLGQPRVYSASASMQINKTAGASGAGGASLGPLLGTGPDLLGEIEVLRSRQIVGAVLEELN